MCCGRRVVEVKSIMTNAAFDDVGKALSSGHCRPQFAESGETAVLQRTSPRSRSTLSVVRHKEKYMKHTNDLIRESSISVFVLGNPSRSVRVPEPGLWLAYGSNSAAQPMIFLLSKTYRTLIFCCSNEADGNNVVCITIVLVHRQGSMSSCD